MSEVEVKISSERIDDIPLIVEWLSRIEIAKYIDQKMKKLHGNHQGMSYGQLSVLLLTYIITQSDHRLCAVEAWVETHRKILELTTGWLIGEKDASDDRLAKVTEELGKQSLARKGFRHEILPCFYSVGVQGRSHPTRCRGDRTASGTAIAGVATQMRSHFGVRYWRSHSVSKCDHTASG